MKQRRYSDGGAAGSQTLIELKSDDFPRLSDHGHLDTHTELTGK